MFQAVLSTLIMLAPLPTGPACAPCNQVERSPLEMRPASFEQVSSLSGARTDRVLIVVADYVAESLPAQLALFQSDIASEGWTVEMHVMSGGTAADIRSLLQAAPDLDGAILVGFLPCAWFEEYYWAEEQFPCELYFMDLDGVWIDSDMDGLYDGHTGDVAPEIWLGRIDAHTAFGPELLLLAEYFEKNHLYRTGALGFEQRALAFNDDDWYYFSHCGLGDIYGQSAVTVVNNPSETTAANYLAHLDIGYEFVHLMSHSCPWGHTFKNPGGMAGTVMAPEISQVNPRTAFLQLFSCSNARWVEEGCLGNWYLFGTDYGLLVTGSAKTGSMLDFEEYYGPLGAGLTFGEAFREWWQYQAQGGGFSSYQRAWFYGNALLGDPTLRPLTGGGSAPVRLPSDNTSASFQQLSTSSFSDCFPAAASNTGSPRRTVAAWLSGENGRLDVAARLYEEGSGWGPVIYVDSDEYWDAGVAACYHDTGPWIAWSDFEYATFSYSIKTACGPDLSQVEVQVDREGYQIGPRLASTGESLWLAWLDWKADGGTVMVKGVDGVLPETQVSPAGQWCRNPDITADAAGLIHIAWEERSPFGSRIMWAAGGETGFSAPVELSSGRLCHSPRFGSPSQEGGTGLTWIDEAGLSSVRMRTLEAAGWGEEEVLHETSAGISGPYLSALPGRMESGIVWQQGTGASASVMALAHGAAEPFELLPFGGPAWSPVSTTEEIFWAGNDGSGWNIFVQELSGLGTGGGTQVAGPSYPTVAVNPVRGSLLITLPEDAEHSAFDAAVYDLSGRAVLRGPLRMTPGSTAALDCSGLAPGLYMVRFGDNAPPAKFMLLR